MAHRRAPECRLVLVVVRIEVVEVDSEAEEAYIQVVEVDIHA